MGSVEFQSESNCEDFSGVERGIYKVYVVTKNLVQLHHDNTNRVKKWTD